MTGRGRPRGGPTASGRAGFTLLEVIVALTILSAGLLLLSETFRGSLRLSGGVEELSAATLYASQRMEEALLAPAREDGEERGSFGDRFRWTVRTTGLPPEEGMPYRPVRVDVSVLWGDGRGERSVELSAVRWEKEGTDAGG